MSQPWMKFYPSDWRSEPTLKLVSRAARSLWIDMLGLMHESGTGRLEVNGRPMTEKELAITLGYNPRTTRKLLSELIEMRVCSRDESGFIVSRRIIRDLKRAERDKLNGRKGGNPSLKTRGNEPKGVNPEVKAQKPEARSQSIGGGGSACAREAASDPPDPPPTGEVETERETVLRAIGADPISGLIGPNGKAIGNAADILELRRWRNDLGLSIPEIVGVIGEVMRLKRDGPPSTFNYFSNPMQRYAGQKTRPALTPIDGGQNEQRHHTGSGPGPTNSAGRAYQNMVAGFARAVSDES